MKYKCDPIILTSRLGRGEGPKEGFLQRSPVVPSSNAHGRSGRSRCHQLRRLQVLSEAHIAGCGHLLPQDGRVVRRAGKEMRCVAHLAFWQCIVVCFFVCQVLHFSPVRPNMETARGHGTCDRSSHLHEGPGCQTTTFSGGQSRKPGLS